MAELDARIIAKASATAGEEPVAGDLEVAELAVNTADGKLFTKHTDNSIVTISGGGGGGAVDSVNGETGVVSLGIQDMNDYTLAQVAPTSDFYYSTKVGGSASSAGEWGTNSIQWNATDSRGATYNLPGSRTLWFSGDGINWVSESVNVQVLSSFYYVPGATVNTTAVNEGWTELYINTTQPAAATDTPLADGDILKWVDADQKFKPAQLPDAAATRVLLGIGEYADDTAAGTGGVASGAMYYNTTSSDYRLKT